MNHFVDRLGEMMRAPLREHMPIAAGPIGTAEPGVGEPHPGAQHDDAERQQCAGLA
jgi:hypothetical protein